MSNVLPTEEQKRVRTFYRTRFIFVGSIAFSIVAGVMLLTLAPSYVLLVRSRPSESSFARAQSNTVDERAEAGKTHTQITAPLPIVAATTSPVEAIREALDGRPEGVMIHRISYVGDASQRIIVLSGTAKSREGINALKKGLEAKGVYKSVSVPVGDLVGATGNQFTITLVSKI